MRQFLIAVSLFILAATAFWLFDFIKNINLSSSNMKITSDAFAEKGIIKAKYTCDGGNINSRIFFENVPSGAKSLAFIMDDPDATGGGTFTHWIVWNIPPDTKEIAEDSVPSNAIEGETDFGKSGYGGPCPPKGNAPHRYFFTLYALDAALQLRAGASREELEEKMKGHIIEEARYMGLYGRK